MAITFDSSDFTSPNLRQAYDEVFDAVMRAGVIPWTLPMPVFGSIVIMHYLAQKYPDADHSEFFDIIAKGFPPDLDSHAYYLRETKALIEKLKKFNAELAKKAKAHDRTTVN